MDIAEQLRQAGFNVPQKPSKISRNKVSMQMKIDKAKQFLNTIID